MLRAVQSLAVPRRVRNPQDVRNRPGVRSRGNRAIPSLRRRANGSNALKQLIINADDFGLTAGISRGVCYAIQSGRVSSTSALVCDPAALALLECYAHTLAGRVGLHLQLTDGFPCAGSVRVPSLVTGTGGFPRFPEELGRLNQDEIRIEWRAQLELFLKSGLIPSHIDTHHHVHSIPEVFEIYCEIAQRCRAPARTLSAAMTELMRSHGIPCADYCEIKWLGAEATLENLLELTSEAFQRCGGHSVIELMCHPGYADRSLSTRSLYVSGRERELGILCSDRLARRFRQLEIKIAGRSARKSRDDIAGCQRGANCQRRRAPATHR
jgi:predicted glycoside hydrolase/deacetylase ChbG (UPF0249 family)